MKNAIMVLLITGPGRPEGLMSRKPGFSNAPNVAIPGGSMLDGSGFRMERTAER